MGGFSSVTVSAYEAEQQAACDAALERKRRARIAAEILCRGPTMDPAGAC